MLLACNIMYSSSLHLTSKCRTADGGVLVMHSGPQRRHGPQVRCVRQVQVGKPGGHHALAV